MPSQVQSIFHLPSFLAQEMSPTEYLERLSGLSRKRAALRLYRLDRIKLSQELLRGSVPEPLSETDRECNFNLESGIIGSGRLFRPKVSKFMKLFPSSAFNSEASTINPVEQDIHTTAVTVGSGGPTPSPLGDLRNLWPNDRGMDTATSVGPHHMSLPRDHPIALANTGIASASRRVTFDLGAEFDVRYPNEQRAADRARSRRLARIEAANAPLWIQHLASRMVERLADGEHSNLYTLETLLNITSNVVERMTEQTLDREDSDEE